MILSNAELKTFHSRIDLPDEHGCQRWLGRVNKRGQGFIRFDRQYQAAKLFLCIRTKRPYKDAGCKPVQFCEHPWCVRHFRWAKPKAKSSKPATNSRLSSNRGDNHYTRRIPGAVRKGKDCNLTKLDDLAVAQMRIVASHKVSHISRADYARVYGTTLSNVWLIMKNKTRKTDPDPRSGLPWWFTKRPPEDYAFEEDYSPEQQWKEDELLID